MIAVDDVLRPLDGPTPEMFVSAVSRVHAHVLAGLKRLAAGAPPAEDPWAAGEAEIIRTYCAEQGVEISEGPRPSSTKDRSRAACL